MLPVDLNCDLGESTDPAQVATDLALLDIITSANIACGGHAGDESTMARTVEAAHARGVAIGAHPGYPDRANFGRVPLDMTTAQIGASVQEQLTALDLIARTAGGRLTHLKLHGALYHKAMHDEATALAVAIAVNRFGSPLGLVAMPDTAAHQLWSKTWFPVLTELFADRAYESDGSLRGRIFEGALITDPAAAAEQAVRLVAEHSAETTSLTLCIHSDTPGAVDVARAVRTALEQADAHVTALQLPRRREPTPEDIARLMKVAEETDWNGGISTTPCDICGSRVRFIQIGRRVWKAECDCGKYNDTLKGL